MNRTSHGIRRPKVRIGISPDPTLLEWVDQMTGPGKRFATRTHAFEAGITCLAETLKEAAAKEALVKEAPIKETVRTK